MYWICICDIDFGFVCTQYDVGDDNQIMKKCWFDVCWCNDLYFCFSLLPHIQSIDVQVEVGLNSVKKKFWAATIDEYIKMFPLDIFFAFFFLSLFPSHNKIVVSFIYFFSFFTFGLVFQFVLAFNVVSCDRTSTYKIHWILYTLFFSFLHRWFIFHHFRLSLVCVPVSVAVYVCVIESVFCSLVRFAWNFVIVS